ncbi:hypothetical protein F183_A12730 [Bryobacterales bacterium F-183]|nr:hypothetical protein F183_A12730 [Bryobacterales bacterium F-183]
MKYFIAGLALAATLTAQVTKPEVAGVTNYTQIESTVACAGATTPEAFAAIKKRGFASVINLRQETEKNANVEAEATAAKAASLAYFHLPLNGIKPDPAVVDRFLEVMKDSANQPAFIHCASGNRAAAMWMIKRVLIDKWDIERASNEATELGLTSAALKAFAFDYIKNHKS